MSRIGKRPIDLKQTVETSFNDNKLVIKGPKGELELITHKSITLKIEDNQILVVPKSVNDAQTPMIGTTWALIRNMIQGVTKGFQKQLNLVGVGLSLIHI